MYTNSRRQLRQVPIQSSVECWTFISGFLSRISRSSISRRRLMMFTIARCRIFHLIMKQFNCTYEQCIYCPQSDDGQMCLTKHCAYFIQCNLCSSSYIGETKRTIRSRLREHLYSKKPPSFIDISLDTTCCITYP